MDTLTAEFIAASLEQNTKRAVAAILGDLEANTGEKVTPEVRRAVLDTYNTAKRILYTKLTSIEVESTYDSNSKRTPSKTKDTEL